MPARDRRVPYWSDILVIFVLAALVFVMVIGPGGQRSRLRVIVAGAFLLFAPGYLFVGVLFPRTDQISLLERATFSVGGSLAVIGLLGIPLAMTVGIDLWTVVAEQAGLVTVLGLATVSRRRRVSDNERANPFDAFSKVLIRAWRGRNAIGGGSRLLQVALLLAILATAGATAYTVATPLPSERYTELYVLGPEGAVEGVPSNVSAGEQVELTIGVTNHEYSSRQYGLQVQVVDATGESRVLWTTSVELNHNRSWERTRSFDVPSDTSHATVEILLFRDEPPGTVVAVTEAYRSVRVELTVTDQ